MYIKPGPTGTNPPLDADRMPIWRAVSGEDLIFTTRVARRDGTPVNPDNSRIVFKLAETRFHFTAIWTGQWNDGISEVNAQDHPGLVSVKIPPSVANQLRRGALSFSLAVSDESGLNTVVPVVGTLLVEYEPTSPQHDIPYRTQEDEP